MTLQNLSLGSNNKRDTYRPISNDLNCGQDELKQSLYKVCKNYGSVFCHTVEYEDSSSDDDSNNNGLDATMPNIKLLRGKMFLITCARFILQKLLTI